MKLTRLDICNFRSFGPKIETIEFDDLTGIIGHNSAGKTTVLNAINVMFGNLRLKKSDFYTNNNDTNQDTMNLSVKARFDFFDVDDETQEYSIPTFFESFTVDGPGNSPYLEILFEADWEEGSTPDGIIETSLNYITEREGEKRKIPMSKLSRSKIDILYIPAVRNPYDQLSNATGTILWRLLKQLNWKEEDKKIIAEKIDELDETISSQQGITLLEQTISNQWKTYHNDNRFQDANLKFGSTDLEKILRKLEVEFSPSPFEESYRVSDLGDGMQSLFYFSLIDAFLKMEEKGLIEASEGVLNEERILNINPPAITILLVEEPENHINPQLLGNAISNLKSISGNSNSQVIFTSHNPSVLKRVNPENIRHIQMNKIENHSDVNRILLPESKDEEYKFVKGAVQAYPELYFSSFVILGEGDSEEILIPYFLKEKFPNLDVNGISIVPLGGRHVNHFWSLLKMLNIPNITLLDFDQERYGGGWERIQYAYKELIKLDSQLGETIKTEDDTELNQIISRFPSWDINNGVLDSWIDNLENYNVYFSKPLDIDFLMLENYKNEYLSTLSLKEGPIVQIAGNNVKFSEIDEDLKNSDDYINKLQTALKHTLKEKSGDGSTYDMQQKELMVWYDYFFLGRGKPVTHRLAIDYIDDSKAVPPVFERIGTKIENILKR